MFPLTLFHLLVLLYADNVLLSLHVFRAANLSGYGQHEDVNELNYIEFLECLVRIANIGFSKHPYAETYKDLPC